MGRGLGLGRLACRLGSFLAEIRHSIFGSPRLSARLVGCSPVPESPHIVFVCTGNAARSVMAKAMFAARADDRFTTSSAGTLVVDGLPMSQRTRNALAAHGLVDADHRSRQLTANHVDRSDLIVTMEPGHVEWVRRKLPAGAARTATLKRLVRDLPATSGPLADRIVGLDLDEVAVEAWEEVVDPAAGEQETFDLCAAELDILITALIDGLLDRAPSVER